jgi:hypothetical protein
MKITNESQYEQAQAFRGRLFAALEFAHSRLSEKEFNLLKQGLGQQISEVDEQIAAYEARVVRVNADFAWNKLGIRIGTVQVSSQSAQESQPSVRFAALECALVH